MLNMDESTKQLLDATSIFTAVGTFFSWLPHLAAIFTIIWTGIRIYETKTVQSWLWNHRVKQKQNKEK